VCHNIFVYDVALSIDLQETERTLSSSAQRETIKHKRRAPRYFEYRPAPLRISQENAPVRIGEGLDTHPQVDMVLYDFGAVSVIYRIALSEATPNLLSLSEILYENDALQSDSRRRVVDLLKMIEPRRHQGRHLCAGRGLSHTPDRNAHGARLDIRRHPCACKARVANPQGGAARLVRR
jgi:hypothetical protein